MLGSGRLRVSCHARGNVVEIAVLGPGDTVGEVSLIDSFPPSADVGVIDRPARLWCITAEQVYEFLECDRSRGLEVMKLLARKLCQRLRRTNDHMLTQMEALRTHFLDVDY